MARMRLSGHNDGKKLQMKNFITSGGLLANRRARILLLLVIHLTTFNAAIAQTTAAPDQVLERGKALVEHNCSQCHSIGAKGKSPHSEAPPFRELLKRYPINALEDGFVDTIYSNHPDMPVFKVKPDQLDAILYYIATIQRD